MSLHSYINPLTTDDAFCRRLTLAACYQLAQSVLKISSALVERVGQGEVGGCTALADSTWRRLQLPVEKPWSTPKCMAAVAAGCRKALVNAQVHGGCCSW